MKEPGKILTAVVEDDESFLNVLSSVLLASGKFSVTPFESGEDFVQELPRTQFDLVILDYKLHAMSGLNVLQRMHEQKLETPVVMLTGAGDETIAAEAMKLGAYDYLGKDQFDRRHFPILAAGVYERYLFRKDKEQRARLNERNLPSLDSLSQSIAALALTVKTALTIISTVTEDSRELAEHLSESEKKEQLRSFLDEMQRQYATVLATTKTIVELSRLIIDRVATMVSSDVATRDVFTGMDLTGSIKTRTEGSGDSRA